MSVEIRKQGHDLRKGIALGFALLSAFLLAFALYISFSAHRESVFRRVVLNVSVKTYGGNLSSDIAAGKEYADRFMRGYRAALEEKVVRRSYSEFRFPSGTNVSGRLVLSKASECFLYLRPDKESRLQVDATWFPVQAALFGGLDTSAGVKLLVPYQGFTGVYTRLPSFVEVHQSYGIVIEGIVFESWSPKVFHIDEDSAIALVDVGVKTHASGGELGVHIEDVGILTGARSFQRVLSSAENLGKQVALGEILALWFKSPLFRKAMTHEEVRPLAEAIETKRSRAKKDVNFQYLAEEQEKDVLDLKKRIREMGLGDEFSDFVLKDASEKVKDGALIYYYPNYRGFVMQWSAIDVGLIALVGLGLLFQSRYSQMSKVLMRISVVPVIVVVNGYILVNRPQDFPLIRALLPGALFSAAVCLRLFVGQEHRS
jgi:hypothetical protein